MSKTPQDILNILHSITKLHTIEDGQLDTYFDNSEEAMGISEFVSDSFTRELLELIEYHLLNETGSEDDIDPTASAGR